MQIQNNNYITNEKLDYLHKEKNNFERFIQNILKEFELMEEIFVIDRIENNIAVCENRSTGKMTEIEISKLPKDIKEGAVLNGEYKIDIEEQKNIEERIKEKMRNIWNN